MRLAAAIALWTGFGALAGATASPLGRSSAFAPFVVGAVPVPPPALVLVSPVVLPDPAPVPPDCASAGAGSAKSATAAMIAAMRPCAYEVSVCSVQPSFVCLRG